MMKGHISFFLEYLAPLPSSTHASRQPRAPWKTAYLGNEAHDLDASIQGQVDAADVDSGDSDDAAEESAEGSDVPKRRPELRPKLEADHHEHAHHSQKELLPPEKVK